MLSIPFASSFEILILAILHVEYQRPHKWTVIQTITYVCVFNGSFVLSCMRRNHRREVADESS